MRREVSSTRSATDRVRPGWSGARVAVPIGIAAGLAVVLSACTGPVPEPVPSPSVTDAVREGTTATAAPAAELALDPAGSAADNLAYFDSVASLVTAIDGRSYVDALTASGFDRSQMEVTFDRTEANLAADTIQFAIRFDGECLLGQNGPASGGYHSAVAAPLASGMCLVGATRSIDW